MATAERNLEELFTPRQPEVLELVWKGLTHREIADVFGIAPGTARTPVAAVLHALNVTSRTEAIGALPDREAARNATFLYEATGVDVRTVSAELDARCVLAGGVRREGRRLRATAGSSLATSRFAARPERIERMTENCRFGWEVAG
jgi:DNA-binding CsgD family transcriptional regulator